MMITFSFKHALVSPAFTGILANCSCTCDAFARQHNFSQRYQTNMRRLHLHECNSRKIMCACMHRTLKSKMYHFTRVAKDHEGRTKKDQEETRRLAKENDDLKQQVRLLLVEAHSYSLQLIYCHPVSTTRYE